MRFSCVTVTTKSRTWILPEAVKRFQEQTYPAHDRELVIVCPIGHVDDVLKVVPNAPNIRIAGIPPITTDGGRRNAATEACLGDWIAVWDDDDWLDPNRLSVASRAIDDNAYLQMIGSTEMWIYEIRTDKAWKYVYGGETPWLIGASLIMRRDFARKNPYPTFTGVGASQTGADTALIVPAIANGTPYKIINTGYVYLIHGGNQATPEIPHYLSDPYYTNLPEGRAAIDEITSGWASRAKERKLCSGQ